MNKKIFDSVHGFIAYDSSERDLIDSDPFQRLRYIHQLGIAFLVYPGATHKRFEHSLGVMQLASRIFDSLHHKRKFSNPSVQRALVRAASLCHDLGHLPFSHAAEFALLGCDGHEARIQKSLQNDELIKLSIGQKKLEDLCPGKYHFSEEEKILSSIITADFFGADRIDYLLRDSKYTGVCYGLFDYQQMIEMLCIVEGDEGLSLGIEEDGIETCEALLLSRYFMMKRVYQHASVKAYGFHLARFLERKWGNALNASSTDNEVLTLLHNAQDDPDARAITHRQRRFKAISLQASFTNEEAQELSKRLSSQEITWEIPEKKREGSSFDFLVMKRDGSSVSANSLSQITVPRGPKSWLFVPPELEQKARAEVMR